MTREPGGSFYPPEPVAAGEPVCEANSPPRRVYVAPCALLVVLVRSHSCGPPRGKYRLTILPLSRMVTLGLPNYLSPKKEVIVKATVLGIAHRRGKSKKNGNAPFDFATLLTLRPIQPVARENFTQSGHGFEVVECKADPRALDSFAGLKFPAEVELTTEARPSPFGELELYVTGRKS